MMNNETNTQKVYDRVLDRLNQRKKLAEIAHTIVNSSSIDSNNFVRESEERGVCPNNTQQGGATVNFVCNSFTCPPDGYPPFACPGDFKCNSTQITYSNCEDNKLFQCNQTTSPIFSCQQEGNTADYFDCRTFKCGQKDNGTTETFDCNSTVDFICGGDKYVCVEDFDCTAGHGFSCTNNHDCGDQFTCSGGEVKGCSDASSTVPVAVSCTKGPIVNDYSISSGGGGGNNDPGDFLCGYREGDSDEFDCTTDFDCEAASDFTCLTTSEFTCTEFNCHSESPFACNSSVTCQSAASFDCSKKDGETYNCANYKTSYAECKSDSEKECKSDYRCPSSNECTAPKFECSKESNMYKCVDSAPAYIPPDTFGA